MLCEICNISLPPFIYNYKFRHKMSHSLQKNFFSDCKQNRERFSCKKQLPVFMYFFKILLFLIHPEKRVFVEIFPAIPVPAPEQQSGYHLKTSSTSGRPLHITSDLLPHPPLPKSNLCIILLPVPQRDCILKH